MNGNNIHFFFHCNIITAYAEWIRKSPPYGYRATWLIIFTFLCSSIVEIVWLPSSSHPLYDLCEIDTSIGSQTLDGADYLIRLAGEFIHFYCGQKWPHICRTRFGVARKIAHAPMVAVWRMGCHTVDSIGVIDIWSWHGIWYDMKLRLGAHNWEKTRIMAAHFRFIHGAFRNS